MSNLLGTVHTALNTVRWWYWRGSIDCCCASWLGISIEIEWNTEWEEERAKKKKNNERKGHFRILNLSNFFGVLLSFVCLCISKHWCFFWSDSHVLLSTQEGGGVQFSQKKVIFLSCTSIDFYWFLSPLRLNPGRVAGSYVTGTYTYIGFLLSIEVYTTTRLYSHTAQEGGSRWNVNLSTDRGLLAICSLIICQQLWTPLLFLGFSTVKTAQSNQECWSTILYFLFYIEDKVQVELYKKKVIVKKKKDHPSLSSFPHLILLYTSIRTCCLYTIHIRLNPFSSRRLHFRSQKNHLTFQTLFLAHRFDPLWLLVECLFSAYSICDDQSLTLCTPCYYLVNGP